MNGAVQLTEKDINSIGNTLQNAVSIIKQIEKQRKSKLLVFYCHKTISLPVSYQLSKILRRMGNMEDLDIMLESGGGDIDACYKILKLLKAYSKRTAVVVPHFAKSGATLISLGADELYMCKGGELGPIDPQVKDPYSGEFIPAHSLKEALKFIEETQDPLVKLSLADKIPVLLMGAYREAGASSKQYLEEIFSKSGNGKKELIRNFTEKYLSHGYPIDRDDLIKIGLKVSKPNEKTENAFCDLHETYADMVEGLYCKYPNHTGEIFVIQSNNSYSITLGTANLTEEVEKMLKGKEDVETEAAAASKRLPIPPTGRSPTPPTEA